MKITTKLQATLLLMFLVTVPFFSNPEPSTMIILLMTWLLILIGVAFLMGWRLDQPKVDIWEQQQELMQAAEKALPMAPAVTRDTVLYMAMLVEQTADLITTYRRIHGPGSGLPSVMLMYRLAADLFGWSCQLKAEYQEPIPPAAASLLLHDVSMLAIITAGLGLSAGLPSRSAFEEMIRSKLSAANPTTHRIDKDAQGLPVKGSAWSPPDFMKVLEQQCADLFCKK